MTALWTPARKTALLLFAALSFCYIALAPGTVSGRGYINEELDSGTRMLEIFNATFKGRAIPPMAWSRHGPIPVLFDLPFIKAGKLFISPDFVLSLQPSLLTAALVALLYLWLRKFTSPGMSMLLSLTAGFGTMLWPYAYIGQETKQSLAVLLAGYMALANGKMQGWRKPLLFGLVCGLAMTLKATGVVLLPAFAFLLWVQYGDRWRAQLAQWLGCAFMMAIVGLLGAWTRSFYWHGSGLNNLQGWVIHSPLQFFTNMVGLFGSPTKGLLVYAPILLAALVALPVAYRFHRNIVIFALLVTACMGGFMSLLVVTSDEVWGPRFMHLAIAPLVLSIGAAFTTFQWRRHAAIVALALVGLTISFLGAFYYYGAINFAQTKAEQNTMEWINGDPVWNEITFNAREFGVWLKGGTAEVMWVPAHLWVWTHPAAEKPWVAINLRDYCEPQSFLLHFWNEPKDGVILSVFRLFAFAAIAGPLLLAWAVFAAPK